MPAEKNKTKREEKYFTKRWGVVITLVSLGILVILVSSNFLPQDFGKNWPEVGEEYWKEQIVAVGPDEAYEKFALSVQGESTSLQHEASHLFGGALFEQVGVEGVSTCDARFLYGCFHEFLGRAIHSLGLSVVSDLSEACISKMGANAHFCYHGVGHGLQSFLGYRRENLTDALSMCKDLPKNDPIAGCYGGVFMEYNMRTMLGPEGTVRFDDDPFDLCDGVPDEAMPACVFWIPQWWNKGILASMGDLEERHKVMGSYCRDITSDPTLVETCFRGVGRIMPTRGDLSIGYMRDLCDVAAETADQQIACRAAAANQMFVNSDIQEASKICENLEADKKARCLQHAFGPYLKYLER